MRLSPKDKRVLKAFVLGDDADSEWFSTNGRLLVRHGVFGGPFARRSTSGLITTIDVGTKSQQTVLRALKNAAKGTGARFIEIETKLVHLNSRGQYPNMEHDYAVYAYDEATQDVLGELRFSVYKREVLVSWVETAPEARRIGVGTALYDELERHVEEERLTYAPTMRTDEGAAFHKSRRSRRR